MGCNLSELGYDLRAVSHAWPPKLAAKKYRTTTLMDYLG